MENKIDELISLIKAMDTKMMFLMEDIEQIKTEMEFIKAQSNAQGQSDSGKAERLAAFREQTQRW